MDDVLGEHRHIYHDNALADEVNRMCLADTRLFLPGLNLAYTDRASMAASVEVRVPFVDPARGPRGVLDRRAARRSGSAGARSRSSRRPGTGCRKRSCTGPRPRSAFRSARGYATTCNDVIHDVLVEGDLVGSGMIRREALLGLIADEHAGREDRSKQLWQLLTLELWHRRVRSMGVAG